MAAKTGRCQLLRRLSRSLDVQVAQRHPRPLPGKVGRNLSADAATGAGDEKHPVRYHACHSFSPLDPITS